MRAKIELDIGDKLWVDLSKSGTIVVTIRPDVYARFKDMAEAGVGLWTIVRPPPVYKEFILPAPGAGIMFESA